MSFVQQKVVFHRGRFELHEQDFVFDVYLFGTPGDGAAHQPFPGGYERGLIKFRFNAECAQHLPHSISDCLKLVWFFGHEGKDTKCQSELVEDWLTNRLFRPAQGAGARLKVTVLLLFSLFHRSILHLKNHGLHSRFFQNLAAAATSGIGDEDLAEVSIRYERH